MTHEALVAAAVALQPTLISRIEEGSTLRKLPDQTIADMKAAGFFKMLQPSRWGGLEVEPRTFFEVQWTLATACPSSAWVIGVVAVHAWQLAQQVLSHRLGRLDNCSFGHIPLF